MRKIEIYNFHYLNLVKKNARRNICVNSINKSILSIKLKIFKLADNLFNYINWNLI